MNIKFIDGSYTYANCNQGGGSLKKTILKRNMINNNLKYASFHIKHNKFINFIFVLVKACLHRSLKSIVLL